jgi:hypothetical protein
MASVIPKEVKKEIIDGYIAETWKVCLLTNAFVYATGTHVTYANLLATGAEVVGTGYTAAGAAVTKSAWGAGSGYVDTTNAMIDATDVAWISATFTARYAAVYNTTTDRIRAIYDFAADKTVTGGTFTIQWSASGLIKIS